MADREARKRKLKLVKGESTKGAKAGCTHCGKPVRWYPCPWCGKGGKGS